MTVKTCQKRDAHKTELWTMLLGGKKHQVQVSFKKIKTVRLRVVAGGQIRLSAPHRTDRAWLEHFLQTRESWIVTNVEKMSQKRPAGAEQLPLTAVERREALDHLLPLVEKWHPVVAAYGIPMPRVTVRRMRSRYGSCSVGRGRITLAAVLLEVPKECAEYVVLHELTHFLYPDHGHDFYRFIEEHMLDWRQRELLLKRIGKTLL